MNIAMNEQQA
jgi:hypothetical protein